MKKMSYTKLYFLVLFGSLLDFSATIKVTAQNKDGEFGLLGGNTTFAFGVEYDGAVSVPQSVRINVKCLTDTNYRQAAVIYFLNGLPQPPRIDREDYKGRASIGYSNNKVTFTLGLIKETDYGCDFECIVDIDDFTKSADSVKLLKAVKPSIINSTLFIHPRYVLRDGNYEFLCEAEGTPNPQVTWKLGDELFKGIGSSILKITAAKMSDSNTYYCFAENLAGRTEDFVLSVYVIFIELTGPRFLKSNHVIGSSVKLFCPVTGSGEEMIYTWRNSKGITIGSRSNITYSISTSEDFGNYTCTAENRAGVERFVYEIAEADGDTFGSTTKSKSQIFNHSTQHKISTFCAGVTIFIVLVFCSEKM